jgi:hypothetical protein
LVVFEPSVGILYVGAEIVVYYRGVFSGKWIRDLNLFEVHGGGFVLLRSGIASSQEHNEASKEGWNN